MNHKTYEQMVWAVGIALALFVYVGFGIWGVTWEFVVMAFGLGAVMGTVLALLEPTIVKEKRD